MYDSLSRMDNGREHTRHVMLIIDNETNMDSIIQSP